MIDYTKLLEQEPEIKEVFLEIVYKTIIAENPEIIEFIYTMLNVGIEKDQIIKVLKQQIASNKSKGERNI